MKRIATEFLIVVAGILVALAVDQWRQDREELRILNDSLADVAQEVRGNIRTVERIQNRALAEKMKGLETVIRFLGDTRAPVDDAPALMRAFATSTIGATPWLVNDRFEALRNSGNLRLLRNEKLANELTDAYEGPHVMLTQVERIQGAYPAVVNELIPATLQSRLSATRWYTRDSSAPTINDVADAASAVDEIRTRRLELLPLARGEAAVATGKWYALERTNRDLHELLKLLAPWDTQAAGVAGNTPSP